MVVVGVIEVGLYLVIDSSNDNATGVLGRYMGFSGCSNRPVSAQCCEEWRRDEKIRLVG